MLTRAPDLRQAKLTSTLEDIWVWKDVADAKPANDLRAMLEDLGLKGGKLGVEFDTVGLIAYNYIQNLVKH